MRGRPGHRDGFTLIEVVVVVVLIGLLFSAAVVQMDGRLPSTRNEAAARQLLAQLDYARIYALSYGMPCEVLLDFDEQRYAIRLPTDEEGEPASDPRERELLSWNVMEHGVELIRLVDGGSGEEYDRGQVPIEFHPGGSGREVWVHLGTPDNDAAAAVLTVRLLALTGIASVTAGELYPMELRDEDF